jgi:hypothetical protein
VVEVSVNGESGKSIWYNILLQETSIFVMPIMYF